MSQYKIYVDLDGVLADFNRELKRLGFSEQQFAADPKRKKVFWQLIGAMAKRGEQFWGVMYPLPDAAKLWQYVKPHSPEILSATGHVGNAVPEKREWCAHYLGADVTVNLVRRSGDKAQYANPHSILIDDRSKCIDPWVAAGGIGILHTSAEDTITALKDLGL